MKKTDKFAYYPADAFSVTANDHSVKLFFGMEEKAGDPDSAEFSVGIYLTPKSVKTLLVAMDDVIKRLEALIGREIDVDSARIKGQIQQANQAKPKDSTS